MGAKTIETLVDDIYGVLDERHDHEVNEDNVQFAGELFKDLLRTRLKKREAKSGEEVLRFSSLGKRDRQLWYAANKPEAAEPLSPKSSLKFLYGDCIEVLLLFLAKEAGHDVQNCQLGVECDGVKGSIDATIDNILTDVKSASSFSFEKFKSGNFKFDDPFGYLAQLGGYANATGHKRAGFLVADKVHGDICFAELDNYDIEGNTPGPRISKLREVIKDRSPPPRCYSAVPEGKSGNQKLAIGCSYCPFKEDCWKDANGGKGLRKFVYSRGPVWLTEVAREPRVDES